MKWKYYRAGGVKESASKWVLGNSWVTKFDDKPHCVIGINGARATGAPVFTKPRHARAWVESQLSQQP